MSHSYVSAPAEGDASKIALAPTGTGFGLAVNAARGPPSGSGSMIVTVVWARAVRPSSSVTCSLICASRELNGNGGSYVIRRSMTGSPVEMS